MQVPGTKGNREAGDGLGEVGASNITREGGEAAPGDPLEGRGRRETDLLEGKMSGTSSPSNVSTKLQKIAKLAGEAPEMVITTLAHHIDIEFLRVAYGRTRKDGAVGVDGQTAKQYEENLEENLQNLLNRFKAGTYKAPPVRRVYIPKHGGKRSKKRRPIGIPTFEDKVLQRAVTMVLEAIYEQDFLNCSYGFRPERSAHQALHALREALMRMKGGWVIEVDIESYFDMMKRKHLRDFLDRRVRDGVVRRTIDKWLKAGVLEKGTVSYPKSGSPQGGVVSPILSNIYLHEVLDLWFEGTVRPRLHGESVLVRFADDFVIVVNNKRDAERVLSVLHKRFGKYGLTLHPEKTRIVAFQRPPYDPHGQRIRQNREPRYFDFLGFTHYWGRSKLKNWVVKRKTAQDRLTRALRHINVWCRDNRHAKLRWQQAQLNKKIQGHYAYYGVTSNFKALAGFFYYVKRIWRRWLCRRSQKGWINWDRFLLLLERYPLLPPSIVRTATGP